MKQLIKYIPLLGVLLVLVFLNDDELAPTIDNPKDYFGSMIFQIVSSSVLILYLIS